MKNWIKKRFKYIVRMDFNFRIKVKIMNIITIYNSNKYKNVKA